MDDFLSRGKEDIPLELMDGRREWQKKAYQETAKVELRKQEQHFELSLMVPLSDKASSSSKKRHKLRAALITGNLQLSGDWARFIVGMRGNDEGGRAKDSGWEVCIEALLEDTDIAVNLAIRRLLRLSPCGDIACGVVESWGWDDSWPTADSVVSALRRIKGRIFEEAAGGGLEATSLATVNNKKKTKANNTKTNP